jgi:tRNA (guanine26-N2/guanine27-N2)-dimethyltransferase
MQTIVEGKARIRIKKSEKISKEMEVFYNPIMKLNRDISILLLNSIDKKNMQIALPLAGSGIRGIRFLKELKKGKIKNISFNDYDVKAINSIKNSLKLNNIDNFTFIKGNHSFNDNRRLKNKKNEIKNSMKKEKLNLKEINNKTGLNIKKNDYYEKIKIYNDDANLFLLNSSGFDYIDVDPFGTSNYYLDAAVKRISRGGILAVTNTDTAALTGTYPKTCIRKYWALPKKGYMMHETGLRIMIRKAQLIGMQYEKALIPIFSYFKDHYFRVFFICIKGKKEADKIAKQQGMLNNSGPLWKGILWDSKLANKMWRSLSRNLIRTSNNKNSGKINNESTKLLKKIKEESKINAVGFHDMHHIAEKLKLKEIKKKEAIIEKIRKLGFKAANSHFSGTGIRTDMPHEELIRLIKQLK